MCPYMLSRLGKVVIKMGINKIEYELKQWSEQQNKISLSWSIFLYKYMLYSLQ